MRVSLRQDGYGSPGQQRRQQSRMPEKFEVSINLEHNPTSKLINRKHHILTAYFPQFLLSDILYAACNKILQDMLKATQKPPTKNPTTMWRDKAVIRTRFRYDQTKTVKLCHYLASLVIPWGLLCHKSRLVSEALVITKSDSLNSRKYLNYCIHVETSQAPNAEAL